MPSDSEIDKTDETSAREKVDSSHKYTPHKYYYFYDRCTHPPPHEVI